MYVDKDIEEYMPGIAGDLDKSNHSAQNVGKGVTPKLPMNNVNSKPSLFVNQNQKISGSAISVPLKTETPIKSKLTSEAKSKKESDFKKQYETLLSKVEEQEKTLVMVNSADCLLKNENVLD